MHRAIATLLLGSSFFACWTNPALSQTEKSEAAPGTGEPPAGLEDIVVTARRISENLQQVPISVGTLNAEALASRQILGLTDLKSSVAGLTTSRTTSAASGFVTIRGVTPAALPTPASDSGVGFYIDGVYIARPIGSGVDIPDLARVEVLRGPQGTLFGRNSDAGAISFITNSPVDRFEGKLNLLYGNYDHVRASGVVNIPVAEGLAIRLAYVHNKEDGDVRNSTTSPGYNFARFGEIRPGRRFNSSRDDSLTAKIRYTGIDGLTLDYKFDYQNYREVPGANQIIGFLPSVFAPTLAGILPLQAPGAVVQSFKRLGTVNEDYQTISPVRNSGHLFTAEYVASDSISLKNITSWRRTRTASNFDLDGADWQVPIPPTFALQPFCVSCASLRLSQHQFSQEDQIILKAGNLNAIVGGYYFVEHSRFPSIYMTGAVLPVAPATYTPSTDPFPGGVPGPYTLGEDGAYRNRSLAGYAHADYAFTDEIKLAAGVRYTHDSRHTDDLRPFSLSSVTKTFDRVTYDVALNYQVTPDKLLYARYGTGYISGGVVNGVAYKPESIKQAEVGAKLEFLDHRLRVNGALYYTWIRDRTATVVSVDPTSNAILAASGYTAPYPLGILQYNLPGTSTTKGFEIETTLVPMRGATLTANYGYNDPHRSDGTLYLAPKQNFSFSGQYDWPHASDEAYLSVRVDGDYRSKYFGNGANSPAIFTGELPAELRPGYASSADYLAALYKASQVGDYWLINGRISLVDLKLGGVKSRLSGYVRNLLNEKGLVYTVNYGFSMHGSFERPRTYGVELGFEF